MKPIIIGGAARLWDYSSISTESLFKITGNTGNLAFRYAIFQHLQRKAKVFSWRASADVVNTAGDIVVLPCANQVGPHVDLQNKADLLAKLELPIAAVGLGAQSNSHRDIPEVPAGTVTWLKEIAARQHSSAPNISVRGEFTRRVLERVGISDNVEVLGCPSLFINQNPHLGDGIARRQKGGPPKITVAAGNPSRPVSSALEKQLVEISLETGGEYIVQHPLYFVKAARGEVSDLAPEQKKRLDNFCGIEKEGGCIGIPENIVVYFDVDAWMERLKRSHLVVGLRIHGVMLALQAGVPALCITHDARTEEMCQVMAVPYVSAGYISERNITPHLLMDCFVNQFDPNWFDQNRMLLANKYREFLSGSGLDVSEELIGLTYGA